MKFNLSILSFAILLPLGHAPAQQNEGQPGRGDSAITRVSVIAIGDPPEPRMDIQGEFRVLVDVPESEYPPQRLFVPQRGSSREEVFIGMNAPSSQFEYRGPSTLRLQERRERGEGNFSYSDYADVNLAAPGQDSTIVLMRSRPGASWRSAPRSMVFRNDTESFPLGTARIFNFSSKPLIFRVGDGEPFGLNPRAVRVVPVSGEIFLYSIAWLDNDEPQIIAQDHASAFQNGDRINLVAYDTDSNNPNARSEPIRFSTYFEFAPYSGGSGETPDEGDSADEQ